MIEDSGREKFTKIIQKAFLSSKIKNSIRVQARDSTDSTSTTCHHCQPSSSTLNRSRCGCSLYKGETRYHCSPFLDYLNARIVGGGHTKEKHFSTHPLPSPRSHIWLRLPRCLLGRDIFWQVARASDGGH